jgi:protease secretion system membrane fusion protein
MRLFSLFSRFFDWLLTPLHRLVKSLNPYVPQELSRDGVEPIRIEESGVKRTAGKLVLVTFVVFFAWAATAPIDQGIVIPGTIVVLGARKAVQHPSGGVVEEIRVKEGDEVKQGDILLRINPLNVDANLQQAENDFINALAAYSRLLAERLEAGAIIWDPELLTFAENPQATKARQLQVALFSSRRAEYVGQREILRRQGESLRQQLVEKERILGLRKTQLIPIAEDAESMRKLAADGFVPRSNANAAERVNLDAQIGLTTLQSDLFTSRIAITANDLELSKLKAAYNKQIDTELNEAQRAKETLRARVLSLRYDQSLASVRAPSSGIIVALKVHTVGGVITGSQVLMEIVPKEQQLIVEAAVAPDQIDKIRVGMPTDLRFTAFNLLTTPVVPGKVKLVGADRLPPAPPLFPQEYFLAQIETTAEGYKLLGENAVVAGMPVEVIVKRGERTFLSYLIRPITDRFARSFME